MAESDDAKAPPVGSPEEIRARRRLEELLGGGTPAPDDDTRSSSGPRPLPYYGEGEMGGGIAPTSRHSVNPWRRHRRNYRPR
jgi:hypothetical protein